MAESIQPLILTLKLDPISFQVFDTLRQQHFPPERNFLPAHVTLFHALPGHQQTSINASLQHVCQQQARFSLRFPNVRSLGKGVAVSVESPELLSLQQGLAHEWSSWLTPQDRQPYRPHITIQNKVMPDVARQLYDKLTQTWKPFEGYGEGLLLWHYQGGPWSLAQDYTFNPFYSRVAPDSFAETIDFACVTRTQNQWFQQNCPEC